MSSNRPLHAAALELCRLNECATPVAKLLCLKRTCAAINHAVERNLARKIQRCQTKCFDSAAVPNVVN